MGNWCSTHVSHGQDYLIPPGAGAATGASSGLRHKVGADRLNGLVAILEGTVAPGEFIPPHTHTREDEVSCVVRGEVTFRVGDDTFRATAGSYVVKPRGLVHAFWNATGEEATIIEVTAPGAFEKFHDAFSRLPKGCERENAVRALQERFGMVIDLTLAAEIAREHGLGSAFPHADPSAPDGSPMPRA